MKTILSAMKTSISEVMEIMFFMPVEFSENVTEKQIKEIKERQCKACCLDFSGDFSGSVYMLVPGQLLSEMTENFMGESRDFLNDEIIEGTLTETVNMVAGNALKKVKAEVSFELGLPKLIPGSQFPETQGILIIETTGSKMAVHVTLL